MGEIEYDPDEDRIQCHLCGRWYRVIAGSHLHRVHGWTLEEYREAFRLMKGVSTVAAGVSTALAAHTRRRVRAGELPADFTAEWRARRDSGGPATAFSAGGRSRSCGPMSPWSCTRPATATWIRTRSARPHR
jgi:ROS/MUCR transcriptional regulator protein